MRAILKWSLLGVVAVSLWAALRPSEKGRRAAPSVTAVQDAPVPAQPAPAGAAAKAKQPSARRTVEAPASISVYYFHGHARCSTCRKLEDYSRSAVLDGFKDDVRDKRITFTAVNVDEPANEHFIQDYKLASKTVVIQKRRGGKDLEWRSLDRIWQLVGDRDAFLAYVRGELTSLRGSGP